MEYTVTNQLTGCLRLAEKADESYSRVRLIWAENVIFDMRSRIKCSLGTCRQYGNNFMCPPALQGIETYREMNGRYKLALLVQEEEAWAGTSYDAAMEKRFKALSTDNMRKLVALEKDAFSMGFPYALAAAGGSCKVCDPCKARLGEKACVHPELARPSMEAMGIDIHATCRHAGLPADFQPGRLLITGMLYLC